MYVILKKINCLVNYGIILFKERESVDKGCDYVKAVVVTLGCKVNAYESEFIKESLKSSGYEIIDNENLADVIVVNTCTVTNQADAKCRKVLRQARKNEQAILVAVGCTVEHHREDLLDLGVDILLGNKDKSRIPYYIEKFKKSGQKQVQFYDLRKVEFEDMSIQNFEGRTRGFVKIQDGCNNFCSYCIIPFMRGNIRSKDINTAYEEIKCLTENGYQEIVLTGIHTGTYGEGKEYNLVDLIKKITPLEGLKRIRFSSIEIVELGDDFLEELRINPKICNHLHIPLQSGCDHTLEKMKRRYNVEEFKEIVKRIREIRPNINLTTDIIVGFPEESDEDFEMTLKNAKEIGFSKIHTFPYSNRKGTLASTMKPVDDHVKSERTKRMLALSDELEHAYYEQFIGQEVEVLVEDGVSGFTSEYMKVHFDKQVQKNTFVKVKVVTIDGLSVNGVII